MIDQVIALQKELATLRQSAVSPDHLEMEVVDRPGEEYVSFQDIDIHNTTVLATREQYAPIVDWFAQKNMRASVDQKELDTTGFFDEVAVELGNGYDIFGEIGEKIRRAQTKGYTNLNFPLAQKSQKDIQKITKFFSQLYTYSFIAKYFYQKKEKIAHISLQTSPAIVQFFQGSWLEWFIFIKLADMLQKKQLPFSGTRRVNIRFTDDDTHELDAVFLIDQSILLCIECKSGEFRRDIGKLQRLRSRLQVAPEHFLLCVAGLSEEQTQGLSSMYEMTVTNEKNVFSHVEQLLASL
ncbi:MAG: DUF1887 family protein [Desulfobulbus sp.]|mgnify:CR=1 FL=1|nr:DUF1887 family protein [Desulfobulbus sp.]